MYDIRQVYQPKDLERHSHFWQNIRCHCYLRRNGCFNQGSGAEVERLLSAGIHRLPQLQGVRREKEELVVGPGTCFDQLHETGVILGARLLLVAGG